MAKFNKKGGGKPRPSYFDKQIEKYRTENFIELKTPREFERETRMIFQDLARGNINLIKHGHYFQYREITEACISNAMAQYRNYSIRVQALDCYISNVPYLPDDVHVVYANDKRKMEAYGIMYNGLLNYVNQGCNPACLTQLVSSLSYYSTEFY